MFQNRVLPAARTMKDFEALLESSSEFIILLESRLSQLKGVMRYANKYNKKIIIHVDLIQGLKNDDFAMEFLFREIKPDGVISTKSNVITLAKRNNILAIQRLFLLDSHALDYNLRMIKKNPPDYLEVLPGLIPRMIKEVKEEAGVPVIAGGLMRTKEDVEQAFEAGAVAVSTSRSSLWDF